MNTFSMYVALFSDFLRICLRLCPPAVNVTSCSVCMCVCHVVSSHPLPAQNTRGDSLTGSFRKQPSLGGLSTPQLEFLHINLLLCEYFQPLSLYRRLSACVCVCLFDCIDTSYCVSASVFNLCLLFVSHRLRVATTAHTSWQFEQLLP